jgi:uncharacterized membrane protein YqjE
MPVDTPPPGATRPGAVPPGAVPPRMAAEHAPIQDLLAETVRQGAELGQKEFALFKEEMRENISHLVSGLVMIVIAAVFGIVALTLLITALVDWLAVILESEALAALICGGVALLIALALFFAGRNAMNLKNLAPDRTARSVSNDARVLSERVS